MTHPRVTKEELPPAPDNMDLRLECIRVMELPDVSTPVVTDAIRRIKVARQELQALGVRMGGAPDDDRYRRYATYRTPPDAHIALREWAVARESKAVPPTAVTAGDAMAAVLAQATGDLAECYRLSGADPSGGTTGDTDEDWRLAESAVQEVRRLRQEYDELGDALEAAEKSIAELDAATSAYGGNHLPKILQRVKEANMNDTFTPRECWLHLADAIYAWRRAGYPGAPGE